MLCAGVAFAAVGVSANAMDFGSNFYGKANVNLGYNLQGYQGDVKNLINDAKDENADTNKYNHGITIGVGYNFYYKLNKKLFDKTIHPFVGLDITGKIPVAGTKLIKETDEVRTEDEEGNAEGSENAGNKIGEYFMFHVKAGAKLELNKDVAISPYYMLGFNVLKYKVDSESKTTAGLSTGVGVETLIKEKYSVALEYRYTLNNVKGSESDLKVQTNNMMLKLGYHFL